MINRNFVAVATVLVATTLTRQADAGTFQFNLAGPGVSGSITLTYGTATDGKYPDAFEVTGISGTLSDSNKGLNIVNTPMS